MTDRHLTLAARAKLAWKEAVPVEREAAFVKAAALIRDECLSRSVRLTIAVPGIRSWTDLESPEPNDERLAAYWIAVRTLAGCLLAEAAEGAVELAFDMLSPALASGATDSRQA